MPQLHPSTPPTYSTYLNFLWRDCIWWHFIASTGKVTGRHSAVRLYSLRRTLLKCSQCRHSIGNSLICSISVLQSVARQHAVVELCAPVQLLTANREMYYFPVNVRRHQVLTTVSMYLLGSVRISVSRCASSLNDGLLLGSSSQPGGVWCNDKLSMSKYGARCSLTFQE